MSILPSLVPTSIRADVCRQIVTTCQSGKGFVQSLQSVPEGQMDESHTPLFSNPLQSPTHSVIILFFSFFKFISSGVFFLFSFLRTYSPKSSVHSITPTTLLQSVFRSPLSSLFSFFSSSKAKTGTLLGRWCHPTSSFRTCPDWEKKVDNNDSTSSFSSSSPVFSLFHSF